MVEQLEKRKDSTQSAQTISSDELPPPDVLLAILMEDLLNLERSGFEVRFLPKFGGYCAIVLDKRIQAVMEDEKVTGLSVVDAGE